ncbi:hypothetical protein KSU03_06085 [Fusobacterium polymorphum]|uniref:Uncharacterized protein n=1 Tax=Fusobacterium nucleatum subsp. polymorphum TaxID=76857 RepID=A0A2C6BHD9_FUSNP|nr:hypothetical protein [Fusobacterium polymorphum]PHI03534.1 hypothetical protein CBG52_12905 [Fusobacterium polymorphum]
MSLEKIVKDLEEKGYVVKTIFPILPNSFWFNDRFENLINDNGFWLGDITYPEGEEPINFGEDFEFTTEDFNNIKWNGYNWLVVVDKKTGEYSGTSYLLAYKDILNLKVEGKKWNLKRDWDADV